MKPRHEKFPKKGGNPHDQTGHAAGTCPKCQAPVAAKPGFRTSALKCPKCGAGLSARSAR